MVRALCKNKLWIFFFVIMALFVPSSISMHAQTEDRSIVLAIGVDKLEDEIYEVSAEIVVPRYQTTFSQNAQVISAVGRNTTDALVGLSLHLGKVIGLSHCSAVIISESLKDENIIEIVDAILRGKRVNYNAQLIYTTASAKEVLKKAIKAEVNFNQNINEIVQFNYQFVNAKNLLLSDFYKTYYQGYGSNFMPVVALEQKDYLGISDSSSSSGSSSSSQGQSSSSTSGESGESSGGESSGGQSNSGQQTEQSKQNFLSNNGLTAVFNKGKFVTLLTSDELKGFGYFTNESSRGSIVLDNVNTDILEDAQVSFSIKSRVITKTINFSKNGRPQIHYTFNYNVRLEQIRNGEFNKKIVNDANDYFTPELKNKFSEVIKTDCAYAINKTKELKLDLLDIYDTFNKFEHNNWQNYLQQLPNKDDYINQVEFYMEIRVKEID